jgi:group I intron endonuclease
MIDKKKLLKEYKQTVQPMGIFQIRNLQNGKIFIGNSTNLNAVMNRFKFDPEMSCNVVSQLKKEFSQYGADNFVLEIIDRLEPKKEPDYNYREDLAELEQMWIDKLQPFGDKGYNTKKETRG